MQTNELSAPPSAAILNADDLLNETEAAKALGVRRQTLSNWRWRGIGPRFHKVGQKLVRYRRADLLTFVDSGGERAA